MRNTLEDLNNHLFAEIERLGDEDLTGEELREEIIRAKALADISTKIIDNASVVLAAKKMQCEMMGREVKIPKMLGGD